jgi:two-component system alkaline phosphatase synthesis response regulator PhoP
MARILVADDDENIRNLVAFLLQREGHEVVTAVDGEDALAKSMPDTPNLLVLDLMMPKMHGFEVVKRIRMHSSVPILMLTSRSAESDKVSGFEVGADDYLTKPFSARELIARTKALLRRSGTVEMLPSESAVIGGLTIDFKKREVTVDGRDVRLTPTEFKVLACLAARPGEVLSGRSLVKTLHGYDASEQEAMDLMRVNINRLRQKIEIDPGNPKYVQTVRGFGYTLASQADAAPAATG